MTKITRWEWAAVAALTLLYFFSFRLSSPLNGPREVFDQDGPHILRALVAGTRYRYNPQHHLLYHALIEGLWRALVTPWWAPGAQVAYVYLKVVAALTGAAYLATLLVLLQALGLSPPRRLVLLFLAASSVTAWFNFAGIETHSLALWAYNVVLLCVVRAVRGRVFRTRDALLLAVALAFAALSRLDNWRLVPLTALLLPFPQMRWRRGRFAAALGLAVVLACAGNLVVGKAYFDLPVGEVPGRILARSDRHDLQVKMKRAENLNAGLLVQMGRATAVYTVMMVPPVRARFTAPLASMWAGALSSAALAGMLLFWARVLVPLARGLSRGDPFLWLITVGWVGALVFYTWFDPFEPFIWLLEFLPLLVALAARTLRPAGRRSFVFLALLATVTAAHNWVDFYRRYDL